MNKCLAISLGVLLHFMALPGLTEDPTGLRLEVIKVTRLSKIEIEHRCPPDVVGITTAVRYRLSTQGNAVYYATYKGSFIPIGHEIKSSSNGLLWWSAGWVRTSPGFNALQLAPVVWVKLPPYCAIEWEELDPSPKVQEKRGISAFIKVEVDAIPYEIISTLYETTPSS